ncbi:phosphatidate cytidylyltransferase [Pseudozyma hubeiensis SY62]|uniref:Phosphatidate cytidylyltransferase n=1 Tax=Pseudozyma hubeiensis (strain SY62) TaxID=1305764 RepID=R9P3X0_PSEHS|nr:phosphatidate cytidylyltransferase [Pseudozyma hubeiensis SY62]GAC95937.1 phosphatidate cytidylyltransferase [Pseudozyma hubeiensis SY62]
MMVQGCWRARRRIRTSEESADDNRLQQHQRDDSSDATDVAMTLVLETSVLTSVTTVTTDSRRKSTCAKL